jgi:hypothetical protein
LVRENSEGGTVTAAVIGDGSGTELRVSLRASDLLERAWSIYRPRLSTFVSLFWGVVVVQSLLMLMLTLLLAELIDAFHEPSFTEACHFAQFLGQVLIPVWLTMGQITFTLALIRSEQPVLEDIFRGGAYLLTMLLAAVPVLLLVGLPVYGAFELGNYLTPASEEMTLGTVSLVLLGLGSGFVSSLYLLARLGQFHYLIIDRGAGIGQALRESWQLTKGRATTVMAVYVLLAGINLVGLVAVFVGFLLTFALPSPGVSTAGALAFMAVLVFTLPFTSLAAAVVYDALGPETLPEVHEDRGDAEDSEA